MDTMPHATSWMDVVMYLIFVSAPIAATWVATLAKRDANEAKRVSQDIHTTLTEKNGGSSTKDQLDRIENALSGTPEQEDNGSVTTP